MQPQGHIQVIRNLIDFGLDAQAALDAPRWYIHGVGKNQDSSDVKESSIELEDRYGGLGDGGFDGGETTALELIKKGHNIAKVAVGSDRSIFGRGQIITRDFAGVLCGGSDPRADGCAIPLA